MITIVDFRTNIAFVHVIYTVVMRRMVSLYYSVVCEMPFLYLILVVCFMLVFVLPSCSAYNIISHS